MPSDEDPPKPKFDPFECVEELKSSCKPPIPVDKKVTPCKSKDEKEKSCKSEDEKEKCCKSEDEKVKCCKPEDEKVISCKSKDEKIISCKPQDKKVDSKSDPCEKLYPKGLDEIVRKKEELTVCKATPPPTCQKPKPDSLSLRDKIKLPSFLSDILSYSPDLINKLKKIDYGKLLQYGFCKLNIWVRENCDPTKMADKGSGAPARPMKFPYTFSAKIAQFPMGHYVKNQWIWRYYVVAFAACMPIFYSINKLANSPGNVAKWAEIRRKEAAEHHH